MKRIVTSVSLVAVGAAGLQAALLPGLTAESGKPWTASATLRGFYDDNINTTESKQSSTGFEISPSLQFSFPMEQTSLTFGVVYSYKYYDRKPIGNDQNYDQTFEFNAALSHAFSERYQISVRDSYVIGQEPDLLRAGNTYTSYQRISGDNMRNYGEIDFSAQITPEISLELGYANTLVSYANDTPTGGLPGSSTYIPSLTGLLDELNNAGHLDLRYQFAPKTIGILGYKFQDSAYTGNQALGENLRGDVMSKERNARSHYAYVGADQNFQPDLMGSVRAGARFTSYYNNPAGQDETSPYAMASLRYAYLPESSLEVGFTYDYSASSMFSTTAIGNLTLNAQSATVYASLKHRIMSKVYGSLLAQYQNSVYYGGAYNGDADNYYLIGLNLQYRFNSNLSVEVGYNYDNVQSQVQATFDRNRVYLGITGTY